VAVGRAILGGEFDESREIARGGGADGPFHLGDANRLVCEATRGRCRLQSSRWIRGPSNST
jgi:hypothetical protein